MDISDPMCGTKIGKLLQLEIIGWDGKRKRPNEKLYKCFCSICAEDTELHGDGVFYSTKQRLKSGKLPCSCEGNFYWTKEQYEIRLNRVCNENSRCFIGWAEEFKNIDSKVNLKCLKDGNIWTTSLDSALQGKMCRECLRKIQQNTYKIPDEINTVIKMLLLKLLTFLASHLHFVF